MGARLQHIRSLRELLDARNLTMDAASVLAGVDTATISRICSGQARPTPQTIVRLATGLGINAKRMKNLCDSAWKAREADHRLSVDDVMAAS